MSNLDQITFRLNAAAYSPEATSVYFKTGIGEYAEHDQFIGVKTGVLRSIAKDFLEELQVLIESPINEKRLLALF